MEISIRKEKTTEVYLRMFVGNTPVQLKAHTDRRRMSANTLIIGNIVVVNEKEERST